MMQLQRLKENQPMKITHHKVLPLIMLELIQHQYCLTHPGTLTKILSIHKLPFHTPLKKVYIPLTKSKMLLPTPHNLQVVPILLRGRERKYLVCTKRHGQDKHTREVLYALLQYSLRVGMICHHLLLTTI